MPPIEVWIALGFVVAAAVAAFAFGVWNYPDGIWARSRLERLIDRWRE